MLLAKKKKKDQRACVFRSSENFWRCTLQSIRETREFARKCSFGANLVVAYCSAVTTLKNEVEREDERGAHTRKNIHVYVHLQIYKTCMKNAAIFVISFAQALIQNSDVQQEENHVK